MKSRLGKLIAGVMICFAIVMISNIRANAANANVSISSAEGSVGDIVNVDVTVTPEKASIANVSVRFDTNYLEYVSGGSMGNVSDTIIDVLDIADGASGKMTLSFKLKKAGTTTIQILDTTSIRTIEDIESLNINKTNGTVNIKAATSASSDSHLAGFVVQAVSQSGDSQTVSYSPSFSPEVFEYKADLPANTVKLVISTTLSDKNSTTKVSGTRIDPGDNKTTITVVAEDGSQSKYTLYTTRPNENETTTNPESPQESSSELQTTDFDRSPKLISDINKYIIQDFSLVSIPEGFEESTATYNGETIAAVKGIAKGLTLLCLADDAQGSNAAFYIYNEISGAIDKMINITSSQKIYTIIPTGDEYVGPNGYTKTELDINGEKVNAWVKTPDSGFYVVYAMNWDGEKALYIYDSKEQTMQRFVEGNKSESVDDEPGEENKEYLAMKRKYDDMYDEYVNDHSKKNKIIIALGIVVICAAIGIVTLIYKLRNKKSDYIEENDDEDELEEIGSEQGQKELKLDMVAQVNEMKAEKLAAQINEMMNESESEDNDEVVEENADSKDSKAVVEENADSEDDKAAAKESNQNEAELNDADSDKVNANVSTNTANSAKVNADVSTNAANSANKNANANTVASANANTSTNAAKVSTNTTNSDNLAKSDSDANGAKLENSSKKSEENEPYLINMEDDDPFEIEFVDLNDDDDDTK